MTAIEATDPGSGRVDLYLHVSPDWAGGILGAEARLTEELSAFAEARAGYLHEPMGWTPDLSATAGIRYRW